MSTRTFGWDVEALENAQKSTNLDVHAAMDIFHAWARNGGKRPENGPARLLLEPFAKGQFGGKSENMRVSRGVLNWFEWDDPTNLEMLLKQYAISGHEGDEIFPASHDQITHGALGTALLVAQVRKNSTLIDLLIEWHQRQFHLCRLLDTSPLKDAKGRLIGPWGPGARADKIPYGSNGGRTLAYFAAQGQSLRPAQLTDRSNAGALAIKSLSVLRSRLLEVPETLILERKLHIAQHVDSDTAATDYVAWFPKAPADYVAVAGVWNGKPFASRVFGSDDEAKIKDCKSTVIVG